MAGEVQDQVWPLPNSISREARRRRQRQHSRKSAASTAKRPDRIRHGNSPSFIRSKMPGLGRWQCDDAQGNLVTIFSSFLLVQRDQMNTIKRRTWSSTCSTSSATRNGVDADNAWRQGHRHRSQSEAISRGRVSRDRYETLTVTTP